MSDSPIIVPGEAPKTREQLWAHAAIAAYIDRHRIEKAIATGAGVWWAELEPLHASEVTALLAYLRLVWNLPPEGYVFRGGRWVEPKTTQEKAEAERRAEDAARAQREEIARHEAREDAIEADWFERSSAPDKRVVEVKDLP